MAYAKTMSRRPVLVARPGFGDFSSSVKDFFGNLFSSYNASQQAQGAANQAAADTQRAVVAQGGGITATDLLLLGGVGVAAVMILKKKRS